jgi:hypothetical protein
MENFESPEQSEDEEIKLEVNDSAKTQILDDSRGE